METKSVLLVDDDSAANFLTGLLLRDCKVEGKVDTALHGKQALDLIENKGLCPDVIFLDVNMPVMDGFDFLRALKNKASCYNHTRVFMLSSSVRDADRQEALSFSCVKGYIEKPLTPAMVQKVFNQ